MYFFFTGMQYKIQTVFKEIKIKIKTKTVDSLHFYFCRLSFKNSHLRTWKK